MSLLFYSCTSIHYINFASLLLDHKREALSAYKLSYSRFHLPLQTLRKVTCTEAALQKEKSREQFLILSHWVAWSLTETNVTWTSILQ